MYRLQGLFIAVSHWWTLSSPSTLTDLAVQAWSFTPREGGLDFGMPTSTHLFCLSTPMLISVLEYARNLGFSSSVVIPLLVTPLV